jgi:hypothetical protein
MFNDVAVRDYAIITYKAGLSGYWKQTDCNGTGTVTNATIQNNKTEGTVGVFQTPVTVAEDKIAYCRDAGLKNTTLANNTGKIHFRVLEYDTTGKPTGGFINDATVKVLDATGQNIIQTLTSQRIGDQDGWVLIEGRDAGQYDIVIYKKDYTGYFRRIDCNDAGSTSNVTIQNDKTENTVAVLQDNATVVANQIVFCKDAGLVHGTVQAPSSNPPAPESPVVPTGVTVAPPPSQNPDIELPKPATASAQ